MSDVQCAACSCVYSVRFSSCPDCGLPASLNAVAGDFVSKIAPPPAQPEPQTTGWPLSELMQDDHSGLSKALSNTPHARLNAREAAAAISQLKPLTYDDIYDIARGTGYVTRGQADEIAAAVIAKQAASPESMGVWQDIATAPKDGRIVLYWVASIRFDEDEETGRMREVDVSAVDLGCWMPPHGGGDGYHDPFAGIPGDVGGPSHWQPLPQPPAAPTTTEVKP
jgi:hypothetical protein